MSDGTSPSFALRWLVPGCRAILALLRGLDPDWAWCLGGVVGEGLSCLPLRDVGRSRQHLAQAFPLVEKRGIERLVRRVWRHAGAMALWTLANATRDHGRLRRGVAREGSENFCALVRATRRGEGTVVLSGHFGNWELLPRLMGGIIPCTCIGRRLRSPLVDALVQGLRSSGGARIVYQDDDARELLRDLRRGIPVASLNDQDIPRLAGGFVPWFGHPAYTPLAPAALAQVSRSAIQCVFLIRHRVGGRGRWLLHAGPRLTIPRAADRSGQQLAMVRWASAYQEQLVRRYPEQWVWWHKRWRTKEGEGS